MRCNMPFWSYGTICDGVVIMSCQLHFWRQLKQYAKLLFCQVMPWYQSVMSCQGHCKLYHFYWLGQDYQNEVQHDFWSCGTIGTGVIFWKCKRNDKKETNFDKLKIYVCVVTSVVKDTYETIGKQKECVKAAKRFKPHCLNLDIGGLLGALYTSVGISYFLCPTEGYRKD